MAHVLFAISANGLGHLAQTAPVIERLVRRSSDLRVTVRSGLTAERLAKRVRIPFEHWPVDDDFGLVMRDSFDPDRAATIAAYRELLGRLDRVIEETVRRLRRDGVDAVVANVGYVAIAAARQAGVPCVAFSSLHWAAVLDAYFGGESGMDVVAAEIRRIMGEADLVLRLEPGLPMDDLATRAIDAAVVERGVVRRAELGRRLGIDPAVPVVVFAFDEAGLDAPPSIPVADGPGCVVVGPDRWADGRRFFGIAATGMSFLDLQASADLVVGKPGYGFLTEVAASGVRCLIVPRPGWPEAPYFLAWAQRHCRARVFERPLGDLRLDDLVATPTSPDDRPPAPPATDGAERIAAAIDEVLGRRGVDLTR